MPHGPSVLPILVNLVWIDLTLWPLAHSTFAVHPTSAAFSHVLNAGHGFSSTQDWLFRRKNQDPHRNCLLCPNDVTDSYCLHLCTDAFPDIISFHPCPDAPPDVIRSFHLCTNVFPDVISFHLCTNVFPDVISMLTYHRFLGTNHQVFLLGVSLFGVWGLR